MQNLINILSIETIFELFILAVVTLFISILLYYLSKKYLLRVIHKFIHKTKNSWDDIFLKIGFFEELIKIIPPLIILFSLKFYPQNISSAISNIVEFWIAIVAIKIVDKFLSGILEIYSAYDISKDKPIKGYIQLIKMVVYILGTIVAICILFGISLWGVLSGVGAFTAVLMFIFKDTILSLVASVQITANDLFKVGDWIEAPNFGADGEVIDIALHSVKVQNWDKTIVTIPTYKFMENSFKNWRGMSQSGGRRIKRSLFIDANSIKFCTPELLEKLSEIEILKDYLHEKTKVVDTTHKVTLNERKLTNIGTFREYVKRYLINNPNIDNKNFTFLVRQLQPTSKGIPLEVYAFSNKNKWAEYEDIQSDIFDHLLVALREFELKLYQEPSGEIGTLK
ncbi:MscS Mechanosensitive ion channel [Sulfurimonas denitrificans DSM 1251]|uniref:MscS Mechanosensitive ion channel n=1 Tax=Sulfurimonas denitrificans (strain ATCC 33889 / DSM 1251) TaxID=326298 RepID=Q30PR8_SULDN|nr:mechanosensitive ion channel family protein [Sulfurimonas denitrificans]ABB45013.1 MscS Mechanosensitive ion channel [Sulfurimonas denitrificans DSM 1251]MDD3442229.1 mechanosensitive ion channel family protein [Sulfurimonas denitrificans]